MQDAKAKGVSPAEDDDCIWIGVTDKRVIRQIKEHLDAHGLLNKKKKLIKQAFYTVCTQYAITWINCMGSQCRRTQSDIIRLTKRNQAIVILTLSWLLRPATGVTNLIAKSESSLV